jgi:Flp pilus assembly protein TadG
LNRISRLTSWLSRHGMIPRGRDGVAAAEFAVIGGVILVILFAVFDFGLWIWQRMLLEGALTAGVHYAQVFPGDAVHTQNVLNVMLSALPPGMSSATATANCTCTPGAPGARVYVTLTISYPYSPLYFTALGASDLQSLQYVVRIQ